MNSEKKILNIGVFGGTQGVGKLCVIKALELGHKITVLARNPSKLSEISEHLNLQIIEGDVLNPEKVKLIVENSNVILNTIGGEDNISSKGTQIIIDAMKEKNIKRIITCSSLGVGESYNDCSFMTKTIIWGFLSKYIEDKNIMEKSLFESELDSIIVRPARLMNESAKGIFITENVSGGSIPREDVAVFMLQQLESNKYLGKAVSLASQ